MKKLLKKPLIVPAMLIVLSALLMLLAEIIQSHSAVSPENYVAATEKKLHLLEKKMSQSLEEVAAITTDSVFHSYFIHHGFQELGFSFFYVENEKITKWSDNETAITSRLADTCKNNSLIHLNNGWYEIFIRKESSKEIIGLLLIRKEYAYENQYLVNRFNEQFGLPSYASMANEHNENSFHIRSANDQPLFAIRFLSTANESINFDFKSWLYMLAFLFFLFAVFLAGKFFRQISPVLAVVFVLVVVAARAWMIHLQIPDEFYSTLLFSPQFYASSFYFNSLGDLFMNSMIIFCLAGFLYTAFRERKFRHSNKTVSFLAGTGSVIFILLLSLPLNSLISGLIMNSKISFDVSNIFGINEYSLLGFLVIAVLLWSYFLISFTLLKLFFREVAMRIFSGAMVSAALAFTLIYFLIPHPESSPSFSLALPALSVVLLAAMAMKIKTGETNINLNFLLVTTLLFSVYASFLIWKLNDIKEKENRKLVAQKIETGQDNLAEYLFEDIGTKISNDRNIQQHFKNGLQVREQVSKRLVQFYFTGYWEKFSISIYCFDRNGLPFDSLRTKFPLDVLKNNMAGEEQQTGKPQLYFLNNESGEQQYMSILPVTDDRDPETVIGSIAVMLSPRLFQSDEGFPELFVSRKVAFHKDLNNYSYARYKNDSLVNQSGAFAYYFSAKIFHPSKQEYSFTEVDGYNHLIHRINDKSFTVVSKSKESILVLFTLFSYLFSLFSLVLLVFYVARRMITGEIHFHLNLTRRIQSSVMLLVILSFVLIGTGTVYYITHKYDVNKDESISEKISSLLVVMEKELGDAPGLNTRLNDETQASLIRLSGTRDADFNLFNPEGNLCYSSQPKIFELGIISQKMNPEALFEMSENGKTQYVHPESIGKLTYISAYEPFRNRQGKMIGYLHLPYFEKQNELNNEISNFLSALINIYVLLFALAILITLFISSRITQPLLLIQEKLGNIRLGRKNELIEYRRHDEIGELVNEYNRMIDELAASTDKLARSERESAWREMAKQVAHEIKNPLTPMKLSVQHLQKAWDEKSPQLNEIFHRISQTLVQQIDTLSTIATEFSNFAQMPPAKKEPVDLNKTLSSILDLFKELPNISFHFSGDQKEKFVYADKDQLTRMFSNLLKNATQAIPADKKGIVQVSVSEKDGNYITSVSDNGDGIPAGQAERIFVPSFTTKSGGMGLGLSIVKSIVESSDGNIRFETKEKEGTTFFVSLPVYKK